jgi:hypothetical protein
VPESVSRSLWRSAAWTGGGAAAAGAVLGAGVGVACWLPGAGVSGHPLSAVRAGLLGFLAAQHAGLTVDGVATSFVPMLAMLAVVVIAWRAGATLAEVAVRLGERRRHAVVAAGLVQAGSYALGCAALVPISALGSTSSRTAPVAAAAFVLFVFVALTSLARSALGPWDAVSAEVLAGARGAAGAVAVYVGSGATLVAGSLVVHADRVSDLSRQVGGGIAALPIAVLGALCAPNAAVAAAAYLAGPGFAVGSGTTIDAFSSQHGVLPAFPLLGALPSGHGASAVVAAWMLATALAAGAIAYRLAPGDDPLHAVAVAAPGAGAGMALLAWLGGGAVGTGRLRTVGASPWQVGLAVAGEVAAVALLCVAAHAVWWRLAGDDPPDVGDEDALDDEDADDDDLAAVGVADED